MFMHARFPHMIYKVLHEMISENPGVGQQEKWEKCHLDVFKLPLKEGNISI